MNTVLFKTVDIVYPEYISSLQVSTERSKTLHFLCNRTPKHPLACNRSSNVSCSCATEKMFKQRREFQDFSYFHEKGKTKNFYEKKGRSVGTGPRTLVGGKPEFGELVNQICTSIKLDRWKETTDVETLGSMKEDLRADLVLEILKLQTDAKKALEFFEWAGQLQEYEHHNDSYSIVVEILVAANMFDAAQAIVEQMKNKQVEVSLVIFNNLIRWYAEHGKIREAMGVFDLIKSEGLMPSTRSYNNILVAFVRGKDFEMTQNIYLEMSGYCVPMNRRTFTTMIHSLCSRNKLEEAKDMLDDMLDKGYTPTVGTYTGLISGFCKKGKMVKAFEILEKMQQQGCSPDVMTYTCIIYGLCLVGKVEDALGWVQKMNDIGCTPDMYFYTVLMDGLCKVGRTDEAKQLLDEAIGRGLTPTILSYHALFNGLFKEGRADEALDLLDEIAHKDVVPDIITYTILIHGLVKWRRISEALKLHDDIAEKGYKLDFPTMSALLYGLCKVGNSKDASRLLRKMHDMGQVHDSGTYNMVIHAHLLVGEMQEALTLFYKMVRDNYYKPNRKNHRAYNAVIHKLCIMGRLGDAVNLLNFMIENGRDPAITLYNILFKELCKEGRKDVVMQLYAMAIKRGLNPGYMHHDDKNADKISQMLIDQGM